VNVAFGFREYDLHEYAKQFRQIWLGEHLDSLTIQKLASRAFDAVQKYAYGKRGKPRFKSYGQLDSVEGKTNASGIRYRAGIIEWLGLELHCRIDPKDKVQQHGLQHRVKYVRLVRRKIHGQNRFYAQLVCEGKPYQKTKNKVKQGVIGLDIGPSTIAGVGDHDVFLKEFCTELADRAAEIRHLQRKLDRQRRANNPENYEADGTIKAGQKTWKYSKNYLETRAKLAELHRQLAAHRKSLHGKLVNDILRMGDDIHLEKLSYRAFQKRYGRSVARRAPGMFVSMLKRKAASASARVTELPTHQLKLSQTCHHCGKQVKKLLSQRWHECECGIVAQRDLYAAFLAVCVERGRLNMDLAKQAWSPTGCPADKCGCALSGGVESY